MTTLKSLTERILLILNDGSLSIDKDIDDVEIQHDIAGACAKQLSLISLSVNYNFDGASIPDGAMVATYTRLPVVKGDSGYCRVMLPAIPMNMPERVGMFALYPSGKPQNAFMYVPPGIINQWRNNRLLNPINKIMYTAESKWADIYTDLIGAGITEVDAKICTVDINLLGDYDPLPISPDMEAAVIAEVLAIHQPEAKKERQADKEAQAT